MLLRLLPWFWLLRLWLLLPVNAVLSSFLTSGGRLSSLASAASLLGAAAPRRAHSQPHRPRRPWHLHMLHVASRCNRSICLYQNIKMKRCRFHSSTLAALTSPLLDDIQFCPLLRICALGKGPGNSSFGISSVKSPAKLIHSSALASPPWKVRQN